jgi:nitrite reductase/ring-hydroxylating ferredoxin subunit
MIHIQKEPAVPELYCATTAEFEEGNCKIISTDGLEIGIFLVGGNFYAYENVCPHQGGPVCQGRLFRGDGYEFDIESGRHPADDSIGLRRFEVTVRDGAVYVVL